MENKIKTLRRIIIAVYVILGCALLLSIACELIHKESFISHFTKLTCPVFLRAPVVLEVIKIIGSSNVFLGWFYANLDKKMIGLSYSEILNSFFPHHHFFTIIHIILTILCIASSAGHMSESALVSFFLVINGFVYQWGALYYIVLNSKCCEELAKYTWKNNSTRNNSSEILASLFRLSKSFGEKNSKHYNSHLECFCCLLTKYIEIERKTNNLKTISELWESLLGNSNIVNSDKMLLDILENIISTNDNTDMELKKDSVGKITSAYIIHKIYFTELSENDNCIQENFEILTTEMWSLKHFLSIKITPETQGIYDDFSNCIYTNLYILAWLFFQYRTIELSKELVNLVPTKTNEKYIDEIVDVLFLPVVKDQFSIKTALQVAKSQLNIIREMDHN